MAYPINEKIRNLTPYEPITGQYPIRLDANESFRQTPPSILTQITESLSSLSLNRYPDPYCTELCKSFAGYYGVNTENVTAWNGSDELISVLNQSFLMKGETVMTLSPDFSMYRFYCGIAETKCVEYQKKPDFSIQIDELISLVKKHHVRMLIFSNPCNPTSIGLKREDIRRLAHSVNCLVALDEAYMDFWDQTMLREVEDFDNLIVLRTSSKAVGAAAIRLGFAVTNKTLTRTLKAVKSPYNVNTVTQIIGSVLFNNKEWLNSSTQQIIASKNELYSMLKQTEKNRPEKIQVYDGVTNFVFVKTGEAKRFYQALLKKGIAIRCLGEYLRISAGTAEENREFIKCFESVL